MICVFSLVLSLFLYFVVHMCETANVICIKLLLTYLLAELLIMLVSGL